MELYQKYVLEREGANVVFTDDIFIKYSFTVDNALYIEDIYVVPEKRKSHLAKEFADKLCQESKALKGCKMVYGSVDLTSPSRDQSIKVLYSWGMIISHQDGTMLYFIKEL